MFALFTLDALAMEPQIAISKDIDLNDAFYSVSALSTTVVVIVDFLKNKYPVLFQGQFLKWFSYILPLPMAYLAWVFGFGMFENIASPWVVGVAGVAASIGAWFEAYVGLANIVLQFIGVDLKARRARLRAAYANRW